MIVNNEADLLSQYQAEQLANQHLEIRVVICPQVASVLIANLQAALRHPGNTGITADITAGFVACLIARLREMGMPVTAQVAELGNNPAFDRPC